MRKADRAFFWVIVARARGVLLWGLEHKTLQSGVETFTLGSRQPAVMCIFCWDDWLVVPTVALAPCILKHIYRLNDAPLALTWATNGPMMDILPFSAWNGFSSVPPPILMRQLLDSLDIEKELRPKSLLQVVAFLVRRLLIGISDDDLVHIMKKRVNLHRDKLQSTLMTQDHLDMADGVIDDGDREDMKQYKKKDLIDGVVDKVATLEFLRGQKLLGSKDIDMLNLLVESPMVKEKVSKIASGTAKKPVTSWTPSAVRDMAPPAKGCVMQRYSMYHRWRAYNLGAQPH